LTIASKAIREFARSLKTDPDKTIMAKKGLMVEKLAQANIIGNPRTGKFGTLYQLRVVERA
jgi:hypothetical protein